MQKFSYLSLILVMLTLVSCGGDKNKSGGGASGVFTNALSTQQGYYHVDTKSLEVGVTTYPPGPQYAAVMGPAVDKARLANLQPQVINGIKKLRATITAQLANPGQVTNGATNYYPQNNYSTQPTLILHSVELFSY